MECRFGVFWFVFNNMGKMQKNVFKSNQFPKKNHNKAYHMFTVVQHVAFEMMSHFLKCLLINVVFLVNIDDVNIKLINKYYNYHKTKNISVQQLYK